MVYTIILFYFIIVVGIGIYSRFQIKNPSDYYVAGKKGGISQVTGSLLATILGGSAILGTFELTQQYGWAAVWFLLCASAGMFILAPLTKYVSRYGKYTLPELLGLFYGKKAQSISSAIIPIAWLGIIAAQIIAAAKILNSIGLMGYREAALLSGAVFILYTLVGGQKSILKTDILQAILILSGILFLFISLQTEAAQEMVHVEKPPGLFNEGFSPLDLVILFLTYSTTFIVGPDIYSRIFCAESERVATRSVIVTAVLLAPFAVIMAATGLSMPAAEPGANEIAILTYGSINLPAWMVGIVTAALLSTVMSSADTTLLTASMILSELVAGPLENKKTYGLTRISIVIIGIFSLIISIYLTSIIQALLIALTLFSGAFFVPMLAGLLKLKVNKNNVIPAIISGGIIALAGKLIALYSHELTGNLIIIFSFVVNGFILFSPFRKNRKENP